MGGSNIGSLLSEIFPVSVLYIIAFLVLFYASTVSLRKGLHKWHDESALKENICRHSQSQVTTSNSSSSDKSEAKGGQEQQQQQQHSNSSSCTHNHNHDQHSFSSHAVISPLALSSAASSTASSHTADSISAPSISSFRIENKKQHQHHRDADNDDDGDLYISMGTDDSAAATPRKSQQSFSTLPRLMEVSGVVSPVLVMQVVALIWVVYTALIVALAKVTRCSPAYSAIFVLLYLPLAVTIVWGVYYNTRLAPTTVLPGQSAPLPPANDMDFSRVQYTLPFITFLIGIICSLLGIGGGELLGPLMLSYGVVPQVSSATTSVLSLLNTSSSVIRSAVKGDIEVRLGVLFFFIGALGGASGRQFGLYIAARYGRPSVIILALVVALYLTCLYYIYQLASSDFDAALTSFC